VSTADLLAPMIVGGIGMGMVFVPLFDIAMAGIRPHEMGSASGVLQTVNSLSMSTGVAALGAIFFSLLGGGHAAAYLSAARWTVLATVVLLGSAFGVAFWLPRRAGESAETSAAGQPEPHESAVAAG
jgi:MFS family permease